MGSFIVRKMWRVVADDEGEAVAKAVDEPDSVRVSDGHPPARHGHERWYTQKTDVLDAAWDLYHERAIDVEREEKAPDTPQLPGFVDLSMAGIQPHHLSLLFDMAITAYRERFEPDGRRTS